MLKKYTVIFFTVLISALIAGFLMPEDVPYRVAVLAVVVAVFAIISTYLTKK